MKMLNLIPKVTQKRDVISWILRLSKQLTRDESPYPPEFNDEFKLAVKKRDGFKCLKCGMTEEDHIKIYGIREAVHHIDYKKENTCFENCCTLCIKCNLEVNSNRYYWKNFFQSLLSERYNLNEVLAK